MRRIPGLVIEAWPKVQVARLKQWVDEGMES
jgi:hypothetical protein